MNKDEILEKSREENMVADERELQNGSRAIGVMFACMAGICALLFVWDFAHGVDTSGTGANLLACGSVGGFFNWRETRFGGYLFCAILTGLGAVSMLVTHLIGTW